MHCRHQAWPRYKRFYEGTVCHCHHTVHSVLDSSIHDCLLQKRRKKSADELYSFARLYSLLGILLLMGVCIVHYWVNANGGRNDCIHDHKHYPLRNLHWHRLYSVWKSFLLLVYWHIFADDNELVHDSCCMVASSRLHHHGDLLWHVHPALDIVYLWRSLSSVIDRRLRGCFSHALQWHHDALPTSAQSLWKQMRKVQSYSIEYTNLVRREQLLINLNSKVYF